MTDLLGAPDPADAGLSFGSIHEVIPESAAPLRKVLLTKAVISETSTFDLLDEVAKHNRDDHEKRINRALFAVLFSAIFAGLAIVASIIFTSLDKHDLANDLRRIFTFLQFAALFVGVFLFGLDTKRSGNDGWRQARAQAETRRLKQFVAVLETDAPDSPANPQTILPLKLAFIRRYLWQAQLYYIDYKLSQADERQANQKSGLNWIRIGVLLAAGLGVLLGLAELLTFTGWFDPRISAALDTTWVVSFEGIASAVAVLALGIIAFRQGREGFHRDNDTRQRMTATQQVMRALGGTWDEPTEAYLTAKAAAEAGNMAPVRAWLDAIMSVQESEHLQWINEMERAVPASTDAWAIWRVLQSN